MPPTVGRPPKFQGPVLKYIVALLQEYRQLNIAMQILNSSAKSEWGAKRNLAIVPNPIGISMYILGSIARKNKIQINLGRPKEDGLEPKKSNEEIEEAIRNVLSANKQPLSLAEIVACVRKNGYNQNSIQLSSDVFNILSGRGFGKTEDKKYMVM